MNEIRIDFEKKLENLSILHDLYLERMLRTSDPLNQDTLLIVVDRFKEEMKTIHEVIYQIDYSCDFFTARHIFNQIPSYKNN